MLLNKAIRKKSKLKLSEQAEAAFLHDYAAVERRFGEFVHLLNPKPITQEHHDAQAKTLDLAAIFGLQLDGRCTTWSWC